MHQFSQAFYSTSVILAGKGIDRDIDLLIDFDLADIHLGNESLCHDSIEIGDFENRHKWPDWFADLISLPVPFGLMDHNTISIRFGLEFLNSALDIVDLV